MLKTTIDDSELALIDEVSRRISPASFDDRILLKITSDGTRVEDAESTRALRSMNERNREIARNIAIDVIAIVRKAGVR